MNSSSQKDAKRELQNAAVDPVLEVKDLEIQFVTRAGVMQAVDHLSYRLNARETLAIVGESGCGKSVSSLAILGLISCPPGRMAGGSIMFEGEDLTKVSDARIRQIRGNEISMIFQEPMTSLNPMMTVGDQVAEPLWHHQNISKREATDLACKMLELVRLPDAERWLRRYPHEMSGGMRQRVMIALALACRPKVLIADEPTTALDVTLQAEILEIIKDMQNELGTAVIMITHDLGVVAETADQVVVMYAGRQVEVASVTELFAHPRHPYTLGLMNAVPNIARIAEQGETLTRLEEIQGVVPALNNLPPGCAFAGRCPRAKDICHTTKPELAKARADHWVACWNQVEP